MFFNSRLNSFLLLLLSIILLCQLQFFLSASQKTKSSDVIVSGKETELSEKCLQLVEQIKKGVTDYNTKLKSGKMEFSLRKKRYVKSRHQHAKKVEYEDVGTWQITYNFNGEHHFYDVKMRKKMEFNGEELPNWKEQHYQFQIAKKTMLIREKKENVWIQHPKPTDKSLFKSEFNPRRWGWNPGVFNFSSLIKRYTPIKVEQVKVNDVQLYLITLHRISERTRTWTQQIWLDPKKGYRPIRVLRTLEEKVKTFLGRPDGTLIPQQPEDYVYHIHSKFQIEQFNPGIWFPKTATYESGYDPAKQQSDIILQMQVHKAVFNIPIDEKDLRFPD